MQGGKKPKNDLVCKNGKPFFVSIRGGPYEEEIGKKKRPTRKRTKRKGSHILKKTTYDAGKGGGS